MSPCACHWVFVRDGVRSRWYFVYKSTYCDRFVVHNVKSLPFLRDLQVQSRVWPQIMSRAPATSALHSVSSSRHEARQSCAQSSCSQNSARGQCTWQTQEFMPCPLLEIAIKADSIKILCIIVVCRETLTGSRYSPCFQSTRSTGHSGIHGQSWRGCKPDISRLCVLMLCECPSETLMHVWEICVVA